MTLGQMGGVGIGWLVGDRFEKRWSRTCMLMQMAGLLLLTYAVGCRC